VLLVLLANGKLLLLGLTKGSTLFTMFLSIRVLGFGVRMALAAGLVVSIYIHEMGHVAALRRFGVAATAPMFVPGLGALVLLRQRLHSTWEDAQVGLAGPLWGLGAAIAAAGIFWITKAPVWGAISKWGALINLFNLIPVWQLDGARGFRAMSQWHRALAVLAFAAGFALCRERLLFLPMGVAAVMVFVQPSTEVHARITARFVALVLAFSSVLAIPMGGAAT
jgi:Zn-dependent protease